VLTASDIGLPLAAHGKAALVPANIAEFAAGLDVSEDDVLLYLALREAAHQRLFAHVPWLREHLIGAVTDYAHGLEVNTANLQSRIEEQLRGMDFSNPESLQQLTEGGLFDLSQSPQQEAALQRLEVTLALVEGGSTRSSARPRPSGCPAPASCRRPYDGAARPADPPSRPSPRWSASSSGRAGSGTRRCCGARCAPGRAPRPVTASG
jgi:putative hydrolase